MRYFLILLLSLICTLATADKFSESKIIILNDSSPISIKKGLIFYDASGTASFEEVRKHQAEFKDPAEMKTPNDAGAYWVLATFKNMLNYDQKLAVGTETDGEEEIYVVEESGKIHSVALPWRGRYNRLADAGATLDGSGKTPSSYQIANLRRGETTQIFSKHVHINIARGFPAKYSDFVAGLERGRFEVYFEGILLGMLTALFIFSIFYSYKNRDLPTFVFSFWLMFTILHSLMDPAYGDRLGEFFIDFSSLDRYQVGFKSIVENLSIYILISYFIFSAVALNLKEQFPKIFWSLVALALYLLMHAIFYEQLHDLISKAPDLVHKSFHIGAPGIFELIAFILIITSSIKLMRKGFRPAIFILISTTIYIINMATGPFHIHGPVFEHLPNSLYFIHHIQIIIGYVVQALVLAFINVSRIRAMQDQLNADAQAHKILVEDQNKVLEETVTERTHELAAKHEQLSEVHELVVGSVNYASRLQRGQLPRQQRIDGRFESFDAIWEPRDTIGGDLWWISSEHRPGPFYMGVADCTGHGVPGAMLSLLVSNSLERIHAGDASPDPASGLMALDHMLRSGLNQDRPDSESDDGCDMALLRVDPATATMQFAGAKIGLFQLQSNGQVKRYAAARVSLGYQQAPDSKDEPQSQTIEYGAGDVFVMVTDGFTDQLGGDPARPRSFGYRQIEAVLSAMPKASASDIADKLKQDFAQWQGNFKRRDDVTALVFRVLAPG